MRDVKYVRDFIILVRFADGFEREVDMKDDLDGEVLRPLKDEKFFRQVRFDSELETAVWPNGADLSPEFLRWGHHTGHDCPCGLERPGRTEA
ncbi:MAG: DUF2442 domain-containing protein [bacterium]